MQCFIQGEEDKRNGVSNPHYVACTSNGEIFCCQNTGGGQNCEAVRTAGGAGANSLLATIAAMQAQLLETQAKTIVDLKGIIADLANLTIKLDDLHAACAPPDLVPVAIEGSDPPGYCRGDAAGNLIVRVRNDGFSDSIASTLRVTFSTPGGPVVVNTPTPALNWGGGTVDLTVAVPPACFDPHDPFPHACNFVIAVDATGLVAESNEPNNIVAGACVPIL